MFRSRNIERTKLAIKVVWYLWIPNKNNKKTLTFTRYKHQSVLEHEVELLEKDV
jgi:hypothetical protein